MSGQYKLTYFNFAALAEPIRWIFKVKNIDFEDERIPVEEWPQHKARFPQGQVPSLKIEDGKELTQSAAIGRYLGKKFELVTNDPYLDFLGDQVVDILTDGRLQWRNFLMEKEPEKKEEVRKNLLDTICPKVLKQLDEIVSSTEGDYITGDKLTWADLFLAHWLSVWDKSLASEDFLTPYSALRKQHQRVLNLPEIEKWIAERPETMV